jgi:hypothetical protein
MLIKRGLPASIVRILIHLYTGHLVRVLWAGTASNYFCAVNGVKQGGVVSPILFCIYIDELLIGLSESGYGCYIGVNFVGALAYADDIVLICPTATAMRKLLIVCDSFAHNLNILFNAQKSKFIVIAAGNRHHLIDIMRKCVFYVGGNCIENVNSFVHLGHIITDRLGDSDDILYRRNCFIGQANNVLCYFNKLDTFVKLNLFKAYCSSLYGCELWNLEDSGIDDFCVAWRKALRRVLDLPYNSHSFLLPLLSDTLPIYDEICKRSARFIMSCLFSNSSLVRSIAWYGIDVGRQNSCVGRNALFCCNRFNWSVSDFLCGKVILHNSFFSDLSRSKITNTEKCTALSLMEAICIREGAFELPLLSSSEVGAIISLLACI